jgi:DNA primase
MFILERGLVFERAGTPEGRAEIARDVLDALKDTESPVTRAAYVRETANRLSLPEEALWREIRQPAGGRSSNRPQEPQHAETHTAEKIWHAKASKLEMARRVREEELVAIVLNVPRVGRELGLTEGMFDDTGLAALLTGALSETEPSWDEELESRRQALLMRGKVYEAPLEAARDLYDRIQIDRERAKRRAQVEKLRELEQQGANIPAAALEEVLQQVRREVRADEGRA